MRRELAWLLGLGLAFVALYVATLCPGVFWGDSAELVAGAVTLGIPHPPGYPLYTWLGHAFVALPLEPARAVNLMSALCGALAVLLCAANARALGASRPSSTLAAVCLGIGPWFWQQATIAEAYTPGAVFLLGAVRLGLLAHAQQRVAWLLLCALLAGAGLGVHLGLATTGLLFVGLAWLSGPRQRPWLALGRSSLAGVVALLGAAVYLWLPYRANQGPALNFGDPRTLDNFLWVIRGGAYRDWFGLPAGVLPRASRILYILSTHLTPVGLALGALGLRALALRQGLPLALAWLAGVLGNVIYFFDYRVFDLEVFFLPAACLLAPCAALQLDQLLALAQKHRPQWPSATRIQTFLAVALLALFAFRYPDQDRSRDTEPQRYGQALVDHLPQGAILLHYTTPLEWKFDCVFEWYFQLVRGARPDVRVLVLPSATLLAELVDAGAPVFTYTKVPVLGGVRTEPRFELAPELLQVVEVLPGAFDQALAPSFVPVELDPGRAADAVPSQPSPATLN